MSKNQLYYCGDFAIKNVEKLWTIKAVGRMVGQTPVVFTVQTPDASNDGYSRMILVRCMNDLAGHFSLWFSWDIFDSDNEKVDKSQFDEFVNKKP